MKIFKRKLKIIMEQQMAVVEEIEVLELDPKQELVLLWIICSLSGDVMEKMKLTMESLSGSILLSSDFDGNLYRLSDGSILKLFNAVYLDSYKRQNIDLKEKMLQVETIHHPRIIVPDKMCCMDDDVAGYIRRDVSGRSFTEFFSNESDNDKVNLYRYALIHHNLESVVEECSDIVFRCLCDETGIYLE